MHARQVSLAVFRSVEARLETPRNRAMAYVAADDRYDRLPYRRTGRSGLTLPAISLGLWQNFGGVDVFETGRAMLRRAFDRGVTHFDLANNYGPPYGSAEENFGRIFAERLPALSRRAGHLDQGRLGHVARPLRQSRLAQISDRQPRPEPQAHGPRLCRHLLPPPARPRHAARGDHGRARHDRCARARRSMSASRNTSRRRRARRRRSSRRSARRCLIHQPRLFDAQPLDRGRAPRRSRRARHRLHRLLAAGPGHALGQIPQGHPGRTRAPPANHTLPQSRITPDAGQEAEEARTPSPRSAARASPSWRSPGCCAIRASPRR